MSTQHSEAKVWLLSHSDIHHSTGKFPEATWSPCNFCVRHKLTTKNLDTERTQIPP